jgi:hypothetical protein
MPLGVIIVVLKQLQSFRSQTGTTLSFSAGNVALASNEWFLAAQVNAVFWAFLAGRPFPSWLRWSALSAGYTRAS